MFYAEIIYLYILDYRYGRTEENMFKKLAISVYILEFEKLGVGLHYIVKKCAVRPIICIFELRIQCYTNLVSTIYSFFLAQKIKKYV